MKRQGMTVSVEQLRVLAEDLEEQLVDQSKELGLDKVDLTQKFQISIINAQEECSDTWEIENNQKITSEDKGNASPSPPPRKKRQPIEGGCIGDSLAPSDNDGL